MSDEICLCPLLALLPLCPRLESSVACVIWSGHLLVRGLYYRILADNVTTGVCHLYVYVTSEGCCWAVYTRSLCDYIYLK